MKKNKFTAIIVSCVVILITMIIAIILLFNSNNSDNPNPSEVTSEITTSVNGNDEPATTEPEETTPKWSEPSEILPNLKELHDKNDDMVGWIKLPNSRVNYPVMWVENDPEFFYERHDFDGNKDIYGVPFIDYHCALDSDHYLIYGHETDNGTQFHDFLQYQSEDFWKNNKTFEFSTLHQNYKYEVVCFSRSKIYGPRDNVFKFYQYYGSKNADDFKYYVDNIKSLQLYETGVQPKYGDHLISLVMCVTPYHNKTLEYDRWVLVARRVEPIN